MSIKEYMKTIIESRKRTRLLFNTWEEIAEFIEWTRRAEKLQSGSLACIHDRLNDLEKAARMMSPETVEKNNKAKPHLYCEGYKAGKAQEQGGDTTTVIQATDGLGEAVEYYTAAYVADIRARLDDEKKRRVYYQEIVYDVMNLMSNGKMVCGTPDEPSTQVQEGVRLVLKHCREFESENAALKQRIFELENAALKQRIIDENKAHGFELRDPNGTIWEVAQKLSEENAELKRNYNELIMAVACKFPNESRHHTALRYIVQAENREAATASPAVKSEVKP
jgi:hypothetical protein